MPDYKDTFKSFFLEPDRPPCTNFTDPCPVPVRSYPMSVPLTIGWRCQNVDSTLYLAINALSGVNSTTNSFLPVASFQGTYDTALQFCGTLLTVHVCFNHYPSALCRMNL